MEAPPAKRQRLEVVPFAVLPIKGRFDTCPAKVKRDGEIGCISRGNDMNWEPGIAALRRYRTPTKGSDLGAGWERFVDHRKCVTNAVQGLEPVLKAIDSEQCGKIDVVTWRGNLTKILCTPYCRNDAWEIGVTKRNGVLFFDVRETAQQIAAEANKTEEQHRMCYWGYKFETFATWPTTGLSSDEDPSAPPDLRAAFCTIAKATVGRHKVMRSPH